jgi:EAL domain-containing protein (putative c-di-GMP-specific phosphodiesterase class I)
VSAIIDLAHALGLAVVAEGVETEEQATVLREMGCDIGQGYLWSRPVPAVELGASREVSPR